MRWVVAFLAAVGAALLCLMTAQAGTPMTQAELNAELGTPCAKQGKKAPCIFPAQMSDLVVTSVRQVNTGLTAAGLTQATATVLTGQVNTVTTVMPGAGVMLPSLPAGQVAIIVNQGRNPLAVYPQPGNAIDGTLAVNWPVTVDAGSVANLVVWSSPSGPSAFIASTLIPVEGL
jgi:hypothetical protein